jgi:HEPN domain-containing protein
MKPETFEWLTRATEDLEALSELNPDRTPSVIASLAHQAIEKTIKAVWIELNLEPPMIHDLEMLWSEIEQNVSKSPDTDDFAEILFEINDYGVQARYPELPVPARFARDAVGLALKVCGYLKTWLENRHEKE